MERKETMIIEEKKGGSVKLTNLFTFPKSKLVKNGEKRDMRKKFIKSDRPTYIINRVRKGLSGIKFASYLAVETPEISIQEYINPFSDIPYLNTYKPQETEGLKAESPIMEITLKTKTPVTKAALVNKVSPINKESKQESTKDYKSMSLAQLIKEENLPIYITSDYRPGAKTASGNTSYHSKKDEYGNSTAYDILPFFNNAIDKSDEGFVRLHKAIFANKNAMEWFRLHGYGIYDETTQEALKRTKGTGKHYHIGPDRVAREGMNSLLSKYGLDLIAYGAKGLKFASYIEAEEPNSPEITVLSPYDYLSGYILPKDLSTDSVVTNSAPSSIAKPVDIKRPVYIAEKFTPKTSVTNINEKKMETPRYRKRYEGRLPYEAFNKEVERVLPTADDDLRDWLTYTAANESNFNWDALNKTSSARGIFLITKNAAIDSKMKNYSADELLKGAANLYEKYKKKADKYKDWINSKGYTYRGALSVQHYIGQGNFEDLVNGRPLRAPKGVNMKLVERILKGEDYNA